MASHSSTFVWTIPWMEEPGGLQSMGSLRVGHFRATSLSLFTFKHWRKKWQPTPVFLPGESKGWRYTVFPSDCTNLHSHQQCMWVFFSPYPLQHLFSVVFLMIIILTGVRWCLTVFLICVSLIFRHVEHLFIYLLAMCIPSLEKMSLQFSYPFFNWGFLCWVVWVINIYIFRY